MHGTRIGFVIWAIAGLFIAGIGVSAFFSKKAVGFWANVNIVPMKDVKKYNRAVGKLMIGYGLVFIGLGAPMLMDGGSPLIILSAVGVMMETIAAMIIYLLVIEKKYREK